MFDQIVLRRIALPLLGFGMIGGACLGIAPMPSRAAAAGIASPSPAHPSGHVVTTGIVGALRY